MFIQEQNHRFIWQMNWILYQEQVPFWWFDLLKAVEHSTGPAWSIITSKTPMDETEPISPIESCYGSFKVCSGDLCNLLRKPALKMSCLIVSRHVGTSTLPHLKLFHVGVHQQVPQLGKFKRFFCQKSQKICQSHLLLSYWSYQDHEEIRHHS